MKIFTLSLFTSLLARHVLGFAVPAPAADTKFPGVVEELKESSSSNNFAIAPDELILRAKDVLTTRGVGLKDNGECLSENFVFRAAFVETARDEFFAALNSFNLEDSFDIKQQWFGWNVDPIQPNRVWVMNRQSAIHKAPFMGAKPTNKTLVLPPQVYHLDFDESGKVTEFGFYTADRAQGNTGGLGGAFGYFYGVGKPLPFPEGKPYKMSLQRRLFTKFVNFIRMFSKNKQE